MLWQAFKARPGGKSHSGHWLSKFQGDIDENLQQVRAVARGRYVIKPAGRYVELRVGELVGCSKDIKVIHSPTSAGEGYLADPSHCDIEGLPAADALDTQKICENIVKKSIKNVHLATVQSD